jgi:DNA polymerase-1
MANKLPEKTLVLLDGSSYLYRAYFATAKSRLSSPSGQPTGAIFAIINMIRKLRTDFPSDYFAIVFDAKGKTFRHDLYEEYKANRPPMPDELRSQVEYVHKIIEGLGFPSISVSGVEADDVIGTLAKQAAVEDYQVIISTGDKDMAQLVSEEIHLVDTMKDVRYDREGVIEKFGVAPEQIIDYLTLIGDTSDNIPGVPKVGPKTAVKWLQQYESLDGILENQADIKGKVGENLAASVEQIPLSKDLATIRDNLDLEYKINELIPSEPDNEHLIEIYQELGFSSWLEDLGVNSTNTEENQTSEQSSSTKNVLEYDLITNQKQLEEWLDKLNQADLVALDTETTSLNALEADLVGMSFAIESDDEIHSAYLPLKHIVGEQIEFDSAISKLKTFLEDKHKLKVGQNLKYDALVLLGQGIKLDGIAFDTMLESYVLDSVSNRHDMDTLAAKHLGKATIKYEDLVGKGKNQLTFDQVAIETAAEYAAEDAVITLQLHQKLWAQLEQDETLKRIFTDIEMPLLNVLIQVESNGVMIDDASLLIQSQELSQQLDIIEQQAYDLAGQNFNLGSPKQIQEIFFEKMGLPVLRKTPKGQPSTAEDVLQELAVDHELPKLILEHRGFGKLKSTYTDKLPIMINTKSNRVHTSYHQAVAITGRLSSSDPNLQNIPIRSAEGRRIRDAFIAPQGSCILAADYSQVELRIMAHLSDDATLLKAFNDGEDIHTATAAEVLGISRESVDSEQRRRAKAINFGLIYGMSAFGLAKQLGVGRNEAQDYIDLYFARYPGVKNYMDTIKERAAEQGYVETVFGRRLYLPDINAKNGQLRKYAERTAINAPMQGTAADIIKQAMIKIQSEIAGKFQSKMIMQVHDELVFEVRENELAEMTNIIRQNMELVVTLNVPLLVEIGVGDNWGKAH